MEEPRPSGTGPDAPRGPGDVEDAYFVSIPATEAGPVTARLRSRARVRDSGWPVLTLVTGLAGAMFTWWIYALGVVDLISPVWRGPWLAAIVGHVIAVGLALWAIADAERQRPVERTAAWVLAASLALTLVGLPIGTVFAWSLLRSPRPDVGTHLRMLRTVVAVMAVVASVVLVVAIVEILQFLETLFCPFLWPCD